MHERSSLQNNFGFRLKNLDHVILLCEKGLATVSAGGVLLMAIMLAGGTTARYALNSPWYFGEEFTGYLLVMLTFFPMAYTLRQRGHVRIDILVNRLPARTRLRVGQATTLVSLVALGIMTFYGGQLAISSLVHGTRAQTVLMTPLWIPQILVPIGLLVFMFEMTLCLIRDLVGPERPDT